MWINVSSSSCDQCRLRAIARIFRVELCLCNRVLAMGAVLQEGLRMYTGGGG